MISIIDCLYIKKENGEDKRGNLLFMTVCATGLLNKRTPSRGIAAIHDRVRTNMLSSLQIVKVNLSSLYFSAAHSIFMDTM